jgi:hypothetical protein
MNKTAHRHIAGAETNCPKGWVWIWSGWLIGCGLGDGSIRNRDGEDNVVTAPLVEDISVIRDHIVKEDQAGFG